MILYCIIQVMGEEGGAAILSAACFRLGAVRRTLSRTDRRARAIEITPEGRRLLALGVDAARRLDDELRAGLSPAGRSALDTLLAELTEPPS